MRSRCWEQARAELQPGACPGDCYPAGAEGAEAVKAVNVAPRWSSDRADRF
jgi:hypothetical protein